MEKENLKKFKDGSQILYYFLLVVIILATASMMLATLSAVNWGQSWSTSGIFAFAVFVPIAIITPFAVKSMVEAGEWTKRKIIKVVCYFACCLLIVLWAFFFAETMNYDYTYFLQRWYNAYVEGSLLDSLYKIVDVSNYTPFYNYFLIFAAKLFGSAPSLYVIKYITYLFSLFLAFVITKIVAYLKNSKFNYLLFIFVLIIPAVLLEFTVWGQCDAIYTSFALLAFYFALRHKSKLCFLFLGLSFCAKLQFLFIVPIIFVMLIVKDKGGEHYIKWKDIWIAPLMYVVNLIPIISGRSVWDLLMVYLNQSMTDDRISGETANICFIYQFFGVNGVADTLLKVLHVCLTLVAIVLILVLVFKKYKKSGLTAVDLLYFGTLFAFCMVFFMPKMLNRFYFIAVCLSIILACVRPTKINILISCLMNFALMMSLFGVLSIYLNWQFLTLDLIGALINFITFGILLYKAVKCVKELNSDGKQISENNSTSLYNS